MIEFTQAQRIGNVWSGTALEFNHPLVLFLAIVFKADHFSVPFKFCDGLQIGVSNGHVVDCIWMSLPRRSVGDVLALWRDVIEFERVTRKHKVIVDVALFPIDVLD